MKKEIDKALEVLSDEIIRLCNTYWNKRTRFEHCTINAKNTDGTYDVRYQNKIYKRTRAVDGLNLTIGNTVFMIIPDNKIQERLILAKIK